MKLIVKNIMSFVKNFFVVIVSVTYISSCSKIEVKKKDDINESKVLFSVIPRYPKEAFINGIEGSIEVEFTITKDAEVKDFVIISSNPKGVFDKEMIKAIKVSLFRPKSVNGVNVDSRTKIKHIFQFEH